MRIYWDETGFDILATDKDGNVLGRIVCVGVADRQVKVFDVFLGRSLVGTMHGIAAAKMRLKDEVRLAKVDDKQWWAKLK